MEIQGDLSPSLETGIAELSETIPSDCWRHIHGVDNPANSASTGIFPSQLASYEPWWCGSRWPKYTAENWDTNEEYPEHRFPSEERVLPLIALAASRNAYLSVSRTTELGRPEGEMFYPQCRRD